MRDHGDHGGTGPEDRRADARPDARPDDRGARPDRRVDPAGARPGDGTDRPSWQGAPGWSGIDEGGGDGAGGHGGHGAPGGPHSPMPGAPPYPPGTEPEPAAPADPATRPGGAVLGRCIAATAGWVAVALLLAVVTGVTSWPLRAVALVVPWALGAAALVYPARRGVGPGGLVALAFAPFWLVHALLVGLAGW